MRGAGGLAGCTPLGDLLEVGLRAPQVPGATRSALPASGHEGAMRPRAYRPGGHHSGTKPSCCRVRAPATGRVEGQGVGAREDGRLLS